jgi:mono/diheme cytochrome c family protein
VLTIGLLNLPACQQQMAKQPAFRPLEPTSFYADGRSARPLPAGTVPRDRPIEGSTLVTGLMPARAGSAGAAGMVASPNVLGVLSLGVRAADPTAEYVNAYPFSINEEALQRGQERYMIFCSVCHDPLGTGKGRIVERGYTQPPSYLTDYSRGFERRGFKVLLRDAPVGYFFEVVTNGFGAMPDYASQVPPADRWKIIAYTRALQFRQRVPLRELSDQERQEALRRLEAGQ